MKIAVIGGGPAGLDFSRLLKQGRPMLETGKAKFIRLDTRFPLARARVRSRA